MQVRIHKRVCVRCHLCQVASNNLTKIKYKTFWICKVLKGAWVDEETSVPERCPYRLEHTVMGESYGARYS